MINSNSISIIGEIAQGYEGNKKLAFKLIKASKSAGVNAVKYQLVIANELATKDYKYYKFFKKLEMNFDVWRKLLIFSKKNSIKFYLDIFGAESLKIAEKLKVDGIKIHPTDLNNYSFLKQVANSKIKKIFIGISGSYFSEILKVLKIFKRKKVVIMFGFQSYPTPLFANQIKRINYIKNYISNLKINSELEYGFADHSLPDNNFSNLASILSIGAGVQYVEKHFTIRCGRKLEDSESAIFPDEFKKYKELLEAAFQIYGKVHFKKDDLGMSLYEKKYRNAVRRSLVTKTNLKKGRFLKEKDTFLKRTSNKKALKEFNEAKGKILKKNLKKDTAITKELLK